ncbi:MAG: sigma-54-dependent Fis family transcriptional regulator [Candidatus Cloacimonetes bacterium]|nr:sigma-54-dependent Fis family transcriptional regulator [Candidatus Cloacimonadota bacterium]
MNKILVIDDDKIVGITLSQLFKKAKYEFRIAYTGKKGIASMIEFEPDIVLLDFKLPDIDGFEVLKTIKDYHEHIVVIMITSFGDIKKAVKAIKMGAYDFITKPFDKEEILKMIRKILNIRKQSEILPADIPKMMGQSKPLQQVLDHIHRISSHDITVFLEGDTGTGKELFARMIHDLSPRREKPFIPVDCGAIPESLFESELFGHTQGAFTGATEHKKGKFELAHTGTLFLDEINNLPLNLQPKFLRALQEKEIQKLGDEKPTKIDVRIIVASNNDIYNDVKKGTLREDLFYRIHEFKINLPTLHERKDDIMTIARYFLEETNASYIKNITGFTPSAIELLENYSWPGNIRELKSVIKSAVLLTDTSVIDDEHLVLKNIKRKDDDVEELGNESGNEEDLILEKFTSKTEEEVIRKALIKAKYNKTKAAEILGISRSQFYKKMEKFNL